MNYEKALRNKYRFPSNQGDLTLEQLFDLPLQSSRANRADLDSTAKEINRALKAEQEDSFVETRSNPLKAELQDKLDIVVGIIALKKAENEAERARADKAATKARLLDVLARRENAELETKSPEELRKMVEEL